jgi:riboflavin synthase
LFTGIIECIGKIAALEKEGTNLHLDIEAAFTSELKIDQSIAHNGVCLTVVGLEENSYRVTAVEETLNRTNLGRLAPGDPVNLERAMVAGMRLDGHMVQGHVDQTARCVSMEDRQGSWAFGFEFNGAPEFLLVEKGSITVDGVSLTVAGLSEGGFSVAIIPFTFEHTIFCNYKVGSMVNLEYDVLGKYVERYMRHYRDQP